MGSNATLVINFPDTEELAMLETNVCLDTPFWTTTVISLPVKVVAVGSPVIG